MKWMSLVLLLAVTLTGASCRQPSVKDLSAKPSPSTPANSEPIYAYLPAAKETLKSCVESLEDLHYINSSNGDILICQSDAYSKVGNIKNVTNMTRGRIYKISAEFTIEQEILPIMTGLPSPAACDGGQNFEKTLQACVPVQPGTTLNTGPFTSEDICNNASLYNGYAASPAGVITTLGPAGLNAQVTCLAGETSAQAIARGSIVSDCPTGSYSNSLGLCVTCAGGTYQNLIGQTQCKTCTNKIPDSETVVYSALESGLTTNSCEVTSATCLDGFNFDETNLVCSPPGVVNCMPGRSESGGTCINCPSGTFKNAYGPQACTACTNNILYGTNPTYSVTDFGLTTNSCAIANSDCIAGFTYNNFTKQCDASSFVGDYTNPPPPPVMNACQGTITQAGNLIACYNLAGATVDPANCPATGNSQDYESPAGTIDAEANSLLFGIVRDASRVQSIAYYCPVGTEPQTVEAANFSGLLSSDNVQVQCEPNYLEGFLQGTEIKCRSQIKDMALGERAGCLVTESGTPYCWGRQDNGILGNNLANTTTFTTTAGIFPPNLHHVCTDAGCTTRLNSVVAISGHNSNRCALTSTGQAYCWGVNTDGRVGDNTTTTPRSFATPVAGGYTFSKIAVGSTHTCAIEASTSKVLCWGTNTGGQLGYGAHNTTATNLNGRLLQPTNYVTLSTDSLDHLEDVHEIASGELFSCAIAGPDRQLYCWGNNSNGRTGINTATGIRNYATPIKIDYAGDIPMNNVHKVAARNTHACAIVGNTRSLYCWGAGTGYKLGTGTTGQQQAPQLITTPFQVADVAVSTINTCISSASNQVYCVGRNNTGQLGQGAHSTDTLSPDYESTVFVSTNPSEPIGALGIFSGQEFYCALNQNKIPHCWGINSNRQLNDSTTTNPRNAPVKMNVL